MIDLIKERKQYRSANKRFRRARRLYVFMLREKINIYRDDLLDYMEERMHQRGIYAEGTTPRAVRQSIQSYLYKIETGKKGNGNWHSWLMLRGWDPYTGYSKPIMQKHG